MPKNVNFQDSNIKYENGKYKAKYQGKLWESSDGVNWYEKSLTQSQNKIIEICDATKDLLLYKNEKYGDSALHPNNVFYKGDSVNSIKIRLDDKIGRIKNCTETRVNDVSDVIGYCVLLLASMGVTKEDIAKLKD